MTGVRMRDDGFEGRCEYCGEYLPLTVEFWEARGGLRRCKACLREYRRLFQRGYTGDPRKAVWRANQRAHYRSLSFEEKERRREVNRVWKAAHREQIAAYNRAYKARTRAAA